MTESAGFIRRGDQRTYPSTQPSPCLLPCDGLRCLRILLAKKTITRYCPSTLDQNCEPKQPLFLKMCPALLATGHRPMQPVCFLRHEDSLRFLCRRMVLPLVFLQLPSWGLSHKSKDDRKRSFVTSFKIEEETEPITAATQGKWPS
jgi:hypothetical protein